MRRSASASVWLLSLLAALGGRVLGPDYRRPPIDAPDAFRFEEKDAKDLSNTAWWEQFQDPVMNELIAIGLAENKDVKIAAARVDQFLGQLASTRSLLFPQLSAALNAQRQRITLAGSLPPPPGIEPVLDQYEAALSVSWEIDVFGKLRRQTEAARASVLASEEGRRATILTLVASVASSYISLRDLDRQLEIAKATAASRADSFKVFQLRFEGGTVSELELAQTQSEYEAALANIPPIETRIAQQEDAGHGIWIPGQPVQGNGWRLGGRGRAHDGEGIGAGAA
jgi:multidrug efflux system outer membrane protein